jgi:hypothetical protein
MNAEPFLAVESERFLVIDDQALAPAQHTQATRAKRQGNRLLPSPDELNDQSGPTR